MCYVGLTYEYENPDAQDYDQAMAWFEKAAAGGHARAMNEIGVMYGKGEGVKQSYATAFMWYEKSARWRQAMPMRRAESTR